MWVDISHTGGTGRVCPAEPRLTVSGGVESGGRGITGVGEPTFNEIGVVPVGVAGNRGVLGGGALRGHADGFGGNVHDASI